VFCPSVLLTPAGDLDLIRGLAVTRGRLRRKAGGIEILVVFDIGSIRSSELNALIELSAPNEVTFDPGNLKANNRSRFLKSIITAPKQIDNLEFGSSLVR
jgi:hypothetical protein